MLGFNKIIRLLIQQGIVHTIDVLHHMLPHCLILRFGDIAWLARLPDLTVPDFFLLEFFSNILRDKIVIREKLNLLNANEDLL